MIFPENGRLDEYRGLEFLGLGQRRRDEKTRRRDKENKNENGRNRRNRRNKRKDASFISFNWMPLMPRFLDACMAHRAIEALREVATWVLQTRTLLSQVHTQDTRLRTWSTFQFFVVLIVLSIRSNVEMLRCRGRNRITDHGLQTLCRPYRPVQLEEASLLGLATLRCVEMCWDVLSTEFQPYLALHHKKRGAHSAYTVHTQCIHSA